MAFGGAFATGQVVKTVGASDVALYREVRGRTGHPVVQRTSKALSFAGEHAGVWLAAGLVGAAVDRDRRPEWLRATATVAGAHVASMVIKRVVRRPRPAIAGLEPTVRTAGRHSFPSSHSVSSAAAAVAFHGLLPTAVTGTAAAATCFSRLVVGVHYPSDVAAGATMGLAAGGLGRAWVRRAERPKGF
ncbi:phosphatase PAP2 family protein [Embleya sp. NPDC056575]|uniref:phosphatase PAP2 family protein n=1 Tax=unclassified Embleya TaxID=2699296 RepID=UPI0036A6D1E4